MGVKIRRGDSLPRFAMPSEEAYVLITACLEKGWGAEPAVGDKDGTNDGMACDGNEVLRK